MDSDKPTCISAAIWNRLTRWGQIKLIGKTASGIIISECGCINIKHYLLGKSNITSLDPDHMCNKHIKVLRKEQKKQDELRKTLNPIKKKKRKRL